MAANDSAATASLQKGIVKQVSSGDSLVIRGYPKGGPPPEKQINLAYVQAPKLSKRITSPEGNVTTTSDEPYGWEAREFLRNKLIGKEVSFKKEYTVPFAGNQRECGMIFLNQENVVESLVSAGLADVIKRKQNADNQGVQRLIELETAAISAGIGKHSNKPGVKRVLSDVIEADKLLNKTFDGIVEHVASGSTLRIAVEVQKLHYQVLTVLLSGIKAPGQGEAFGGESKFFTESRLLHRDIKVRIEAVNTPSKNAPSNQGPSFSGSVICNGHNIAEHLLKEGMAKCMDWTLAQAMNSSQLRAAETEAKKKKLRLWKDYTQQVNPDAQQSFLGKVVEVINADALMIENQETKEVRKIFLASIRPPPRREGGEKVTRVLYDVPFMFEAREFLRTRLIGKKVRVQVDYIQPKSEQFPEKVCASVFLIDNNINVAEALLAKGLATTVRYKPDDESRASCYDVLREAESKAQAKKLGLHGNPEKGVVRIIDLSSDSAKAKSFLPFFTRGNARKDAVVEHVYSASRIKVFIPKENTALNIILAGISSPKATDSFGPESTAFLKSLIVQRSVQIQVESMDKVGNFIGYVFHNSKNLSLELLKAGFASIRDARSNEFRDAEEEAKKKRLNIWKDYKEPEKTVDHEEDNNNEGEETADTNGVEVNGKVENLESRTPVVVTQVADDLSHLFIQVISNGPALAALMDGLRQDLEDNPPLPGAYTAKKGEVVAAKFSADDQWYRARVDKIIDSKKIEVTYIDYGNKEFVKALDLAPLPDSKYSVASFPEGTKRVSLAFVSLPDDQEVVDETRHIFEGIVFAAESLLMKVEYKDTVNGLDYVTLVDPSSKKDIVMKMVEDGLFMLNRRDRRRERHLQKTLSSYKSAQDSAKKNRLNLWQYGDFTDDDAREFGFSRPN